MERTKRNEKHENAKGADETEKQKKAFDKKKYREQKYSYKYKVNQWEERRKMGILNRFYKEIKREGTEMSDAFESKDVSHEKQYGSGSNQPKTPFFKAKQEYRRKLEEKQKKKREFQEAKEEREEALRKYKRNKLKAFKELSKKTKKGQPVMKGRMELLLEKIRRTV